MYKCDVCGKFTKESDLSVNYTPDSHYTNEDIYYECKRCCKKCVCGQNLKDCVDCPYGPDQNGQYW